MLLSSVNIDSVVAENHCWRDLVCLFNGAFKDDYQTELVRGNDEPIYKPASGQGKYHRVVFAHGFYASALHEISHWCIAGERRRAMYDYGYWYIPDGRDRQQQAEFERVECKPQAIEWIFSVAVGCKFCVSVDNLESEKINAELFKRNVYAQVLSYFLNGLPGRAETFKSVLLDFYGGEISEADFELVNL